VQLTRSDARTVNHAEHALDRVCAVAPLAGGIGTVKAILRALAARSAAAVVPALFPFAVACVVAANPGSANLAGAAKGSIGERRPSILRGIRDARLAVVARIVDSRRDALIGDHTGGNVNYADASVVLAEIIGAGKPVIGAFPATPAATVRATLLAVAVVKHAFAEVADLPAAAVPTTTATTIVATFDQFARNVCALPTLTRLPAPALAAAPAAPVRSAHLAGAVGVTFNLAFSADAHWRGLRAFPAQSPATIRPAFLVVALRFTLNAALVLDAKRRSLRAFPATPAATIIAAFFSDTLRLAFDLACPVDAERRGLRAVAADATAAVVSAFVVATGGEAACFRGGRIAGGQRPGGVVAAAQNRRDGTDGKGQDNLVSRNRNPHSQNLPY